MYNHVVSHARVRDDESRTVREMLAKIVALDKRPLTEPRDFPQRLIGCCRDYALLLAAMLRHQGVPARVRFGFARNLQANFGGDHMDTEYWDANAGRWKLVDAQQDERHIRADKLQFDPYDIPHQWFPFAGEIWQQARAGEIDPHRYGYSESAAGMWVIQTYLGLDLAALNKREMLIGDQWELASVSSDEDTTAEEATLLDHVADLTLRVDETWPEALAIYEENAKLRVPSVIGSFSLAKEYRRGILVGGIV